MSSSIQKCKDEQILKELCSVFKKPLVLSEINHSIENAASIDDALDILIQKFDISQKSAEFIMDMTISHFYSLNYDTVKYAYESLKQDSLNKKSYGNKINIEYYLPLIQEYCQKTMSIYDNHYHQGPFIPYTMSKYGCAPLKIMYVGRDTLSWEPAETLKKAFQENRLEDYLIANTRCVDVKKMLEWKNNTGSFWNFVDKLHLLIRTGQLVSDITSIDDNQRDVLEEIGYGNLHSIELIETLRHLFEEPEMPVTQEYLAICKAAKPFETLKSMIEAYQPDYVFVLSWIEKNEFFDGTDFEWQKNFYHDTDKKYRAVYLSNMYKTKVIWTLHPNAMWRKGLNKEDTVNLMEFLANTLKQLESTK